MCVIRLLICTTEGLRYKGVVTFSSGGKTADYWSINPGLSDLARNMFCVIACGTASK